VFVFSSSNCGVVLLTILCGVWFRLLLWCSFSSCWKIDISQLQVQSVIWASTLQIRKHENFGDLDFILLFVGILSLYAINLDVVSLFADSSFTFLAMFVSYVMYSINLDEWILLFLSKKQTSCLYPKKKNFHKIKSEWDHQHGTTQLSNSHWWSTWPEYRLNVSLVLSICHYLNHTWTVFYFTRPNHIVDIL